jgi:hypothetical protein
MSLVFLLLDYGKDNWCVGSSWNSLFEVPNEYGRCTSDTNTDLDKLVAQAPADIKRQCQGHVDCIIDTIVTGNIDVGLRTLSEAKEKGFVGDETLPEPTENDMVEEDDTYTCLKAGVGSETAFARPSDGSNCFIKEGFSNSWGWRLEMDGTRSGTYEYNVWAGAGQCNTDAGEMVGKVTVDYNAETKQCIGVYESTGGYTLQEFQFYCGGDPYPKTQNGKGEPTVAPGQYPCKQVETESETHDTCVVKNVQPKDGKIHAIAHAVSCDEPEGFQHQPEPETQPQPEPEPSAESNDKSVDETPKEESPEDNGKSPTKPEPKSEPQPDPESGPQPEPESEPQHEPESEPQPEPEEESFKAPGTPKQGSGSGDPHFKVSCPAYLWYYIHILLVMLTHLYSNCNTDLDWCQI